MAIEKLRRNVAGVAQTAVGGIAAVAVLSDWTNADGWIATVELVISGHGVTSGAAPAAVGALVAATIIEEDAAWDAIVALNVNNVEVQITGDAAEVVDWSWSGTIYMQRVI
jgi:hypothetical protein